MPNRAKVHKVMAEFKRGTLRSSAGYKVTSREQAVAIAMREAGYPPPAKRHRKRHHTMMSRAA
jgi:hypothetical protein